MRTTGRGKGRRAGKRPAGKRRRAGKGPAGKPRAGKRPVEALRTDSAPAPQYLLDKHYMRKHGPNAYYGQGGAH